MSISAEIIKDSINNKGKRITTWVLTYPRFIHAEFMTHRVFSRNAASSRAIPIKKVIDSVIEDPAMPVYWGQNQAGMKALQELPPEKIEQAKQIWLEARENAIETARKFQDLGLHKQISNRVLEPWFNMKVLATATEHKNFFELRAHKDAQPEFKDLAFLMKEKYESSTPNFLKEGEWHIPYEDNMPEGISLAKKLRISTARCARVSYLNFEGKSDPQKDDELYDTLFSEPLHASPFEHCACNLENNYGNVSKTRNFVDWTQYRSLVEEKVFGKVENA